MEYLITALPEIYCYKSVGILTSAQQ